MKLVENCFKSNEFGIFISENTDGEGFLYAFSFISQFSKEKRRNSFVRKRILIFPTLEKTIPRLAKKEEIEEFFKKSKKGELQNISHNNFNPDSTEIPKIISETIKHLQEFGCDTGKSKMHFPLYFFNLFVLKLEGLFRECGIFDRIQELTIKFDKGEIVDLKNEEMHTVGGILKSYIIKLNDPLLTFR